MTGENIKQLRRFHGYNREELAERIGMSVEAYASIENGAYDLFVHDLKKIAEVLATTTAVLVD